MTLAISVDDGATDSTVPSSVASGSASSETSTCWPGAICAASFSWNGATTEKPDTPCITSNCEPPGRVGDAPAPEAAPAPAAPLDDEAPGMAASAPGANGVVPEL